MSSASLPPSAYCSWLSRPLLRHQERQLVIKHLEFGNEADWRNFDQVTLPPQLEESQDLVVLALRSWATRDPMALAFAHRQAVERAHLVPLGFLELVLQEALRLARRSRLSFERQVLPIYGALALAEPSLATTFPKEFSDMEARGLFEIARLFAPFSQEAFRKIFREAESEYALGTLHPELGALALEIAALGATAGGEFGALREYWCQIEALLEGAEFATELLAEKAANFAEFLATLPSEAARPCPSAGQSQHWIEEAQMLMKKQPRPPSRALCAQIARLEEQLQGAPVR